MRQLVLATRNLNKVREIKTLLEGLPFNVVSLRDLPELPPPVEEDQPTLAGNALKKAEAAAAAAGGGAIVMADDSGLEVEALGGQPGVHTARFAGSGAGDAANNRLLLQKLHGIPPEKRDATFRCAIAIIFPDGESCVIEESCPGRIADSPRGEAGFGYDPLFIYEEAGFTFAEMEEKVKNRVSHRGKALRRARLALEHRLGQQP